MKIRLGALALALWTTSAPAVAAEPEAAHGRASTDAEGSRFGVEVAAVGTMYFKPDGNVAGTDCQLGIQNPTFGTSSSLAGGVMVGGRFRVAPDWNLALPLSLTSNGSNTHFGMSIGARRGFGRIELGASLGMRYALINPRLICSEGTGVYGDFPTSGFFAPTLGADARVEILRLGPHLPLWASLGLQLDLGSGSHADQRDSLTGGTATITTKDRVTASPVLLVGATF